MSNFELFYVATCPFECHFPSSQIQNLLDCRMRRILFEMCINGSTTVNHPTSLMGCKINSIIIIKDIEFTEKICFIIITDVSLNGMNYHIWRNKMKDLLFVMKLHLPIFATIKPEIKKDEE